MANRMIQKEIEDLFKNVSPLQISTALLRLLFFGNVSEESADRVRAWYFDERDGKRKIKDDALEIVFNEMLDQNDPPNTADIEKARRNLRKASEKEIITQ